MNSHNTTGKAIRVHHEDAKVVHQRLSCHVVDPETGCWNWAKAQLCGYGVSSLGNCVCRAHRLSFAYYVCPVPDKAVVAHRCDNKACINPSHLFLTTQQGNMKDMVRKGRGLRGEAHPQAQLTTEDVREIKQSLRLGVMGTELAHRYGVTPSAICAINKGVTWSHIK